MRRLGLAGLIAAAVVTAAVVGALGSGSAGAARVTAAAAKLDASTSRFTLTASYEPTMPPGRSLAEEQTWVMRGQMDYQAHRGTVSYGKDEVVFEAVFDGDVTYIREPFLNELLHSNKDWVKAGPGDGHGRLFDPGDPSMADPATLLSKLEASSDDVRDLGVDVIDGHETRHYAGTFDLAKVVPDTEDERWDLQAELEARAQFGESTRMPYDAWVQNGVIRRLTIRQSMPEPVGELVATVDFYDFGAPVEISVPAADQVMSSEEFAALMEAAATSQPGCEDNEDSDVPTTDEAEVNVCFYTLGNLEQEAK